jgi:hypothetical protein
MTEGRSRDHHHRLATPTCPRGVPRPERCRNEIATRMKRQRRRPAQTHAEGERWRSESETDHR